jgi:hypothetical protein
MNVPDPIPAIEKVAGVPTGVSIIPISMFVLKNLVSVVKMKVNIDDENEFVPTFPLAIPVTVMATGVAAAAVVTNISKSSRRNFNQYLLRARFRFDSDGTV